MFSSGTTERLALGAATQRQSRSWAPACILLGVCLMAPALGSGLLADDYLQQLMLRDDPGIRGLSHRPLDLFRFADGRPESARALIEEGVFPWWTDPHAQLSFFRPLASLTHWLDHQLWPDRPALMHAHSLVWFALVLCVVAALYRRFGAARSGAGVALLLFAIDDAHAPLVAWIANRNALVALCLALPALLWHERWRRGGGARGGWLGPGALALGLCAGEAAVLVLPYLLAYAACLDRGSRWCRYGALVPYVLVAGVWKLVCLALGLGVVGSGLYFDPLRQPLLFLGAACERLPVLGLGLLAAPFADLWELYPLLWPGLRVAVMALALVVLATFALVLRPLLVRDARVRFWATGMALSLLPLCATFPHDRLLLAPGIGAMALIAVLLEAGWAQRARLGPLLGTLLLLGVHGAAAGVLAPLRAADVGRFDELLRASDATLPADPGIRARTLVLLNPPLDPFAAYLPAYRQYFGIPRPRQQLWLASGVDDVAVTTLDAHSLAIRQRGGFISASMQRMLRSVGPELVRGGLVRLDGVEISIGERGPDQRPHAIIVRFQRELADPSLLWFSWQGTGYVPFELPAVGREVVLPRAPLERLLFGRTMAERTGLERPPRGGRRGGV